MGWCEKAGVVNHRDREISGGGNGRQMWEMLLRNWAEVKVVQIENVINATELSILEQMTSYFLFKMNLYHTT